MASPRRRSVAALLALAVIVAMAILAWPAGAAGPWKGQVVDAETGAPLEGVIVVGLWDKRTATWPHHSREFHDVDEVVTDHDGRFVIPARDLSKNNPFQAVVGPVVKMLKPGYKYWQFKGATSGDTIESSQRVKESLRHFASDGAVFELVHAETDEERRRASDCQPGVDVPIARIPRWREACTAEQDRLRREQRLKR